MQASANAGPYAVSLCQLLFEPEGEHGAGDAYAAFLDLDKLLPGEGAFHGTDICGGAQLIFLQYFLRGKFVVYAVDYGAQEVYMLLLFSYKVITSAEDEAMQGREGMKAVKC